MEIGEEGAATMAKKNTKKLNIEDYLDFIDNRDLQLNSAKLRKIIAMHGFKKIDGQKSILIDAVKTMDLMDLRRSTLQDGGVSGDACLTLKEVIKDLRSLQWQECHVTSLITQGAATSATNDRTISVKGKRSKGVGKKRVAVLADSSIISTTANTVAAGSTTVSVKRRKSKGLGKKSYEVAADDSIISSTGTSVAAESTTDSIKDKKSKGLGKKPVGGAADDSIISTARSTVAAGSTTVSVKRKRSKGLGMKPVEVAVDHSIISTLGTTVAAESTTAISVDCNSSEF